jgi:hypothetical protein
MAIQIEFLNLVIKRSSLDQSYPGGSQAFIKEHQPFDGRVNCYDEFLVKFGAMSSSDMNELTTWAKTLGLADQSQIDETQYAEDFCVLDELMGPLSKCDWIEYDQRNRLAYLKTK